jgi:hypothetical protein
MRINFQSAIKLQCGFEHTLFKEAIREIINLDTPVELLKPLNKLAHTLVAEYDKDLKATIIKKNMSKKLFVLPTEVNELAVKVSPNKQVEVQKVLTDIFTGTDDWEKQVDAIEVKDINDKMSIQLADVARKNAKTARLSAEKIFDAKRDEVHQLKAEFDIEDKLWLKAKQVMQIKFKAIEDKAEWKANFVKRYEAEQKELRTQNRILQVAYYAEINRVEFENMSDDSFASFLGGLKATQESKIAEAKRIEEERIAREKADVEAREQQRLENERLKAEAEAREKAIAEERKENERKAAIEREKQRIESERLAAENAAKLNSEREAREKSEREAQGKLKAEQEAKAKLEAELIAKKEAEINSENERKEAELKAQKEAAQLAKAPIKKQLKVWVDNFQLPNNNSEHYKAKEIIAKFEAFKNWAKKEIESI